MTTETYCDGCAFCNKRNIPCSQCPACTPPKPMAVKSDRYPLLPTQCRNRLVEAIRAADDSHAYAVQEDGGLYDFVEPSQVARLLSEGCQVYRVTLENPGTTRATCPMGCDGQQTPPCPGCYE